MIKLDQVSKIYNNDGASAIGIQGVSCEFKLGEFVAITGESGSGKSTMLNVISMMDSYEEGELFIDGKSTVEFSKAEFANYRANYVSFIFQEYNLVDSFSVIDNIMLPLLARGMSKSEAKVTALRAIKQVGLERVYRHKATKLSGGEKQRTVIARALVSNAPIIACDEPTGNLDSETAKQIIKLLADVAQDKLILYVTHDYDSIRETATRHIIMKDGHIDSDVPLKKVEDRAVFEQVKKPRTRFSRVVGLGLRDVVSTPKKSVLAGLVAFLVSFSAVAILLGAFYLVGSTSQNIVVDDTSYVDPSHANNRVAVFGQGANSVQIADANVKIPTGTFVDYGNLITSQTISRDSSNISNENNISMHNLSDGNSYAGSGFNIIKSDYSQLPISGSAAPIGTDQFALGITKSRLNTFTSYDSFKKAIGDEYTVSPYDTSTSLTMTMTAVYVIDDDKDTNSYYVLLSSTGMQAMYDEIYRVVSSDSAALNGDASNHPYLSEASYTFNGYSATYYENLYGDYDHTKIYASSSYAGFDLQISYRGAIATIPTNEIEYLSSINGVVVYQAPFLRYFADQKQFASFYAPSNSTTTSLSDSFIGAGFSSYIASSPKHVTTSIDPDTGYANLMLSIAYSLAFIASAVIISFLGSLIIGVIYNDRKKDYAIFTSLSFSRAALRGINAVEMLVFFITSSLVSYFALFGTTLGVKQYCLAQLNDPRNIESTKAYFTSIYTPFNSLYSSCTNPWFIVIYFLFNILFAFLVSTWIMNKFSKKTLTTNMRKGGELL